MGGMCSSATVSFTVTDKPGQDDVAVDAFRRMKLKQDELDKLFNAYHKIDCSNLGYITSKEFREFFRADDTRYNRVLLTDFRGTGKINFFEFVAVLWKVLAEDPGNISALVFNLCNRSGYLATSDARQFMETLHGRNFEDTLALKMTLQGLVFTPDGLPRAGAVTCGEFVKLCSEHPVLIGPMLRSVLAMRKDFLGEFFWKTLSSRKMADKETASPAFIYQLTEEVVRKYEEKEMQVQLDERAKRLGGDRRAIQQVYKEHDATAKASKDRTSRADEIVFDHNKVNRGVDQSEFKRQKKAELKKELEDEMAIEVINGRNCPEKLQVLQNHEFRYVSEGLGPAMPGSWNSSPTLLKPSSPQNSPRGLRSTQILPSVDRPNSRGKLASPRQEAGGARRGSHSEVEGERPKSRGTMSDTNDRPNSRGKMASPRQRDRGEEAGGARRGSHSEVEGERPRSRGNSIDLSVGSNIDGRPKSRDGRARPASAAGNRNLSPLIAAEGGVIPEVVRRPSSPASGNPRGEGYHHKQSRHSTVDGRPQSPLNGGGSIPNKKIP